MYNDVSQMKKKKKKKKEAEENLSLNEISLDLNV